MKSKEYFSNLVKIDFTDDEYEKIQSDYIDLLRMIDRISEVDTDGIEPLFNAPDYSMSTQNKVSTQSESDGIFKNATESVDDFFIVPLIIKN